MKNVYGLLIWLIVFSCIHSYGQEVEKKPAKDSVCLYDITLES